MESLAASAAADAAAGSPAAAPTGVTVIIPAWNEVESIAGVIRAAPRAAVDEIIVADGASRDGTAQAAEAAGARVIQQRGRGYGAACASGVAAAAATSDILVFLDGDGSDRPELLPEMVGPIRAGTHDFVIGSRVRGVREPGSMSLHQIFAGWLIGWAVKLATGVRYTDMCPFRAIRRDALDRLGMRETTYGWNIEMQMRAAQAGLRILEIPVAHGRRTGGVSKVAGTLRGTIRASWRILLVVARITLEPRDRPHAH